MNQENQKKPPSTQKQNVLIRTSLSLSLSFFFVLTIIQVPSCSTGAHSSGSYFAYTNTRTLEAAHLPRQPMDAQQQHLGSFFVLGLP